MIVRFAARSRQRPANVRKAARVLTADAAKDVPQRLKAVMRSHDHDTVSTGSVAARTMNARRVAAVTAAAAVMIAMLAVPTMPVAAISAVRPRFRWRCCSREKEKRKDRRNVPHGTGFRRRRMNRE